MSKKVFNVALSREVTYLSVAEINIEAYTEEEAKDLALRYAIDIDGDQWEDSSGLYPEETYSIDFTEELDLSKKTDDHDIVIYNRDDFK